MRIIGYLRVSTSDQVANGNGLEAQESSIRATVAFRGWELVELIRDDARSGKDLERPGFRRALEAIARGEADGLIVAKLDRATRSLQDLLAVLDWFNAADKTFVALDVGIDSSTEAGWFFIRQLGLLAEWERRRIASRTKDALAELRRQGRPVSRPSVSPELAGYCRRTLRLSHPHGPRRLALAPLKCANSGRVPPATQTPGAGGSPACAPQASCKQPQERP
jgi:DNA invertase Pin-like site-specific DNA recombinase